MTAYMKLDDDEFVKEILDQYKESRRHQADWRREAKELYEFRAGKQWTDDELSYLQEQKRPPVTFNRAGTIIDAVVGAEVSNRQEIRFFPRTMGDAAVNESETQVVKWVRDQCNAEDEETDSLEDVLICGVGWTDTRIDYDTNIDGNIIQERVDPIEMYWDASARKHNLEDANIIFREKWLPKDEIKERWPDAGEIIPSTDVATELDSSVRNADPPFYERESTGFDRKKGEVRVLECQFCERSTFYRVENPLTGAVESVDDEKFSKLKERFPDIRNVKQRKKKWFRAFIGGGKLLERDSAPIVDDTTFKAITGKRDKKDNTWFGLMRGIKEPQEWANKFFSQILHVINSNSKGGIYFESGAFKDINLAKEQQAKPEGMVELNPGGLNKIKEKQMFQFPASIDRMLEFAISSIRDVPGVNLEMLGAANRDQAGVLEAQRTRQALGVLAPIFNNLRRYRKNQGHLLIKFIKEYIADGRLIRIIGDEGAKTVPLMKDSMTEDYDIIVDQSPSSPNSKTEAWMALRDVLPVLQAAQFPVPKEIVDILPLPESIIGKWKEQIKQGPQIPDEIKQQMEELQQENQMLQQKNQELQQKHDIKVADMQGKHQIKAQEMQMDQARLDQQSQMDFARQQQELEFKRQEAAMEIELKNRELAANMRLKEAELHAQFIELQAKLELKMQEMEQNLELKRIQARQSQ